MKKTFNIIALITLLLGLIVPTVQASYVDLSEVEDDTSPSLSSDLNTGGNDIVSTSGGNVIIDPLNPNGDFQVSADSDFYVDSGNGRVGIGTSTPAHTLTIDGDLGIRESAGDLAHYVIFSGNAQSGSLALTLPTMTDTEVGQVIATDGSGNLDWYGPTSGIANLAADGNPDLGGPLNVSTFDIISLSNGDIVINPAANFHVNTDDLFINNSLGKVGIGSTDLASTEKLHVVGTVTATDFTGNLTGTIDGNAATASALSANGANCGTAGDIPRGFTAAGVAENCFDVWTDAENTAAAFVSGSTPSLTTLIANTHAIIPKIIGGDQADSSLTLQATTAGSSATGKVYFNVQNNGYDKALAVSSNGNVSIGATGSTNDKFFVRGPTSLVNIARADGTSNFFITDDDVGVGTTDPQQRFHVSETTSGTNAVERVARFSRIFDDTTPINGAGFFLELYQSLGPGGASLGVIGAIATDVTNSSEEGAIFFSTIESGYLLNEEMRIVGDGNVGIGATDPAAALHVLDAAEQLRLAYDSTSYLSVTVDSAGIATFDAEDSGSTERFIFSDYLMLPGEFVAAADGSDMKIDASANFGLGGVDPTEFFDIGGGDFKITSAGAVTAGAWQGDAVTVPYGGTGITGNHSTGDMLYSPGSSVNVLNRLNIGSTGDYLIVDGDSLPAWSDIMVLKSSKVGVGVATPLSTFHVNSTKYFQAGNNGTAAISGDCDSDTEIGRLFVQTTNERFYVCMGTAGWFYATFTN